MTQHRLTLAPAVALAIGLVFTATLSGCTAGTASSSGSAGSSGSASSPRIASSTPAKSADRDVVSTGTVSLTVDNPTDAATRAVRIVESAGGRVDDRTEHAATTGHRGATGAQEGRGSATLTLRIPAAELTPTLARLRALGEVEDVSISARDVTAERTDLDARVTALRASVDRLVDLLKSSATTADLISIESALSQRQSDLEALEAQQAALGSQIALATITLQLGSVVPPPAAPMPADFLAGLSAGWNALISFATGVVVIIGVLLPWLLPPAIIAAVLLLLLRRRRRAQAA